MEDDEVKEKDETEKDFGKECLIFEKFIFEGSWIMVAVEYFHE